MTKQERVLYVVVASEHNVAELLACLTFRPAAVFILASDFIRRPARQGGQSPDQRLEQVLRKKLPGTEVRTLAAAGLTGSRLSDDLAWLRTHLVPLVEAARDAGLEPVLNLTGGTKTLTVALLTAVDWSALHYKDLNSPLIQEWIPGREEQARDVPVDESALARLLPSDFLRLYADDVKAGSPADPGTGACRTETARWIHDELSGPESDLAELFGILNRLWYPVGDSRHSPKVHCENARQSLERWLDRPVAADVLITLARTLPEDLQARLTTHRDAHLWRDVLICGRPVRGQRDEFDHVYRALRDEVKLRLPEEYRTRRAQASLAAWCGWFAGGWLEDWLYDQVCRWPGVCVERNVRIAPGQPGGREIDLLIRAGDQLLVVEVKADIAPGQERAASDQLETLARLTGKARRVLYAGPVLARVLAAPESERALRLGRLLALANAELMTDIDAFRRRVAR